MELTSKRFTTLIAKISEKQSKTEKLTKKKAPKWKGPEDDNFDTAEKGILIMDDSYPNVFVRCRRLRQLPNDCGGNMYPDRMRSSRHQKRIQRTANVPIQMYFAESMSSLHCQSQ
jgi:ubiquinone biosynthesis protein Coq4